MSFLGKVKKKLRNGSWYPFYNTFYEKNNLDPHMILLESRSGKALESNILSLLKELCQEPYRSFTLVLSVHRDSENEIKEKLQKNSIQEFILCVPVLLLITTPSAVPAIL